jgi:type IV fimbrial biogenesis protein FimT
MQAVREVQAMERQQGITLAELLVAVALAALLAGLAVPALDRAVLNARRTAAMEALLRAAWFARSEAHMRGRPVVLCASGGSAACVADQDAWSGGWLVAAGDAPGQPLHRGEGAADPRARILGNRAAFSFQPFDRRSTNGTLAWCDRRGAGEARALVIAPTGRPRIERGPGALACPK